MLKMEQPGKRKRRRSIRRFMDIRREDRKVVGVKEEDEGDRKRGLIRYGAIVNVSCCTIVLGFLVGQKELEAQGLARVLPSARYPQIEACGVLVYFMINIHYQNFITVSFLFSFRLGPTWTLSLQISLRVASFPEC